VTLRPILDAILVVVAIWIAGMWIKSTQSCITRANFDRIQVGMTRERVEDILGGPAPSRKGLAIWWGRDIAIELRFGRDDTVSAKGITIFEDETNWLDRYASH
jgi:hypothetical protein